MIGLELQHPDKVYNQKSRAGWRKSLAQILKVPPQTIDTYMVQKGSRQGLSWNVLQSFIREHLHDKHGTMAFALAIYGLIIFPKGQGYIETAVIEVFQQIHHGSNLSVAILAETFRSLNYYRCNKDECFLGCIPLSYIWIKSHIKCEGITFTKPYLPGASPISEFCKNTWPSPKSKECR